MYFTGLEKAFLAGLGLLMVAVVAFVVWAIGKDSEHRVWFMSECMKDHKEYECDAMLRAGDDRSTTTVVPMPVIIR